MADKPTVVISRCINLAPVRYDGGVIEDRFARELGRFVRWVPVCPEMEIGLGCPRPTIRLVKGAGGPRLVEPVSGRDLTATMQGWAAGWLDGIEEPDGFLLKSRSPSCGIGNVKLHHSASNPNPAGRTLGLFAAAVLARFPDAAAEDEGRLHDAGLRSHFLTKLFARHRVRRLAEGLRGHAELVRFHAKEKLLLMAYHQTRMRELGRIVANADRRTPKAAAAAYREAFHAAFARQASHRSAVNVLEHAYGFVKGRVSAGERRHLLGVIGKYGDRKLPLSAAVEALRAQLIRFEVRYLLDQTFFQPCPEPLMTA